MKSIDEALALVCDQARPLPPVTVPLAEALGRTLAEDVVSDIDSPPHDKSMVDGYAVVAADLASGTADLTVLEEITAGAVPTQPVVPGTTTRIMTGAPIPRGADAVVMIERSELADGGRVRLREPRAAPNQNILRQGVSLQRGAVVLNAGRSLRPIELGVLAEVGRANVAVFPAPTVGVLATGNELVEAGERPGPGCIRNSNGPLLTAWATSLGSLPRPLGVARDTAESLEPKIRAGLACDVLLLSGGVSAGVLDLVPQVLSRLGVREVFHKVDLKPGKPLWFGTFDGPDRRCLVFGLPGNPVGTLVCSELFVRPALGRLAARADSVLATRRAFLSRPFRHRADRPTYYPGRHTYDAGRFVVDPLPWQGSADLRTLADATCLVELPSGEITFAAEAEVSIRVWSRD